ncbi:MAG: MotA/TolQ/ExbB proton channel family protein [bacterium]|nr:MotA/TolQ/ExbB proton channel family protein [bacterium]
MNVFSFIAEHYRMGGFGMHLILGTMVFAIAIGAERIWFIFFKNNVNANKFTREMLNLLKQGKVNQAKSLANSSDDALHRVSRAALNSAGGSMYEVQDAVDEASLNELPRLERRTLYMGMLANAAVLMGLFGTILGLIKTFSALGGASAAEKTIMLSEGIAEAMNCTAYGLLVAIPAILIHGLLVGKTRRIMSDIDASLVPIINAIAELEGKV